MSVDASQRQELATDPPPSPLPPSPLKKKKKIWQNQYKCYEWEDKMRHVDEGEGVS